MNALKLWDNPLVVRSVRTRLRLPLALSWALVTIVASSFLFIIVYGNAVKNGSVTQAEAAREAIFPLLIMQGVILMVLGTGAVAGGMARERTYRLLDYQRLTPMSPSAKIVGMLVGLPIREYFMFAISLPFVFYAAAKGGIPMGVLVQFYIVFLSSAVVYHMTGLAAGMVVGKPWQAGTVSQGLVIVLYLLLPQVSHFGFTFFEFLTARPVFYGLVEQYLLPDGLTGQIQALLADPRYTSVAFFGMQLSPVLFSLAVQGFALVSLYVIVYRKWQSESRLPFSKGFALLFFALAQLFLVGSVTPFLADDALFTQLTEVYVEADPVRNPSRTIVFAIFMINLSVSGCAAILTVYLCTPRWYPSLAGLRRSLRLGRGRLSWADDAASGLPVAAACILMSWLGCIAVYQSAAGAGRVGVENPVWELALPLVLFAVVLLTVQQVVEQFSERVFVMGLFVCWMVPVLGALIIGTALDEPISGVYAAVPFPFTGIVFSSLLLMTDASTPMPYDVVPLMLDDHKLPVTAMSVLLYLGTSASLLLRARRRWARMRAEAGLTPKGSRLALAVPEGPAAGGAAAVAVPVPVPVEADERATRG